MLGNNGNRINHDPSYDPPGGEYGGGGGYGEPGDYGAPGGFGGGGFGGGGFGPPKLLRDGPAWEHRAQIGFMTALTTTIKECLFAPSDTFSRMIRGGGLGAPLGFAFTQMLVFGLIAQLMWIFIQAAGLQTFADYVESTGAGSDPEFAELLEVFQGSQFSLGIQILMAFITAPIAAMITPFISSAVAHVCLMITGGANHDFETTFRAVCYSKGSAQTLQLIPCFGPYIAIFWELVIRAIALRDSHETETWKAVLSVLLPWIAVCCIVGGFVAVAVSAAGMAAA